MSDLGDLAARIAQLSDADLVALVQQSTAARPALSALHAAAEAAGPTSVPGERNDGGSQAAPLGFSVADVNTERRAPKVRQDRIDDIRDSLRKSLKRED